MPKSIHRCMLRTLFFLSLRCHFYYIVVFHIDLILYTRKSAALFSHLQSFLCISHCLFHSMHTHQKFKESWGSYERKGGRVQAISGLMIEFDFFSEYFSLYHWMSLCTCSRSNANEKNKHIWPKKKKSSYIKANAFAAHLITTTDHFCVFFFIHTIIMCTEWTNERFYQINMTIFFFIFLYRLFQQIDIP